VQDDGSGVGVRDGDAHDDIGIALHHGSRRGEANVDAIHDCGVDGTGDEQAGGSGGEAIRLHEWVSRDKSSAEGSG
jgi:hypothetical protein